VIRDGAGSIEQPWGSIPFKKSLETTIGIEIEIGVKVKTGNESAPNHNCIRIDYPREKRHNPYSFVKYSNWTEM
jgi:hypothetical protein